MDAGDRCLMDSQHCYRAVFVPSNVRLVAVGASDARHVKSIRRQNSAKQKKQVSNQKVDVDNSDRSYRGNRGQLDNHFAFRFVGELHDKYFVK